MLEPMQVMTQQGTTKTKAGTMRCCARVVVVKIVGYLIQLGFFQNTGIRVGEGGEWLYFVEVEGAIVKPGPILLVEDY